MERLFIFNAVLTIFSGVAKYASVCSGLACDISQFWQFLQCKLQPTVAIESILEPGKKWNKGFFSIGSR